MLQVGDPAGGLVALLHGRAQVKVHWYRDNVSLFPLECFLSGPLLITIIWRFELSPTKDVE